MKAADTDAVHPVRQWLRQWLRLWRDERIEMSSSLPVPAALEQFADVTSWQGQLMRSMELGWGSRIVVGEVSLGRLRLTAMRPGVRNSFRPVLHGELTPTSDGCVLRGTIGWRPAVRVVSILWMSMCAVSLLMGVVGSVGFAAAGDEANAMGMLTFAGATVVFGAIFVGLLAFGGWLGRKDDEFLRRWLSARLQPSP